MLIHCDKLVLGDDFQNGLQEEFTVDYKGAEKFECAQDVYRVLDDVFGLPDLAEEHLFLICMNTGNRPIRFFKVAHGLSYLIPIGIREIFSRALLCGAFSIILAHNHPSGNPEPSEEDMEATMRIKQVADLLEMQFFDHIIAGRGAFYSFREADGEEGLSIWQD